MTWVVWITAVIAYGFAVMQRTSLGVMGLTAAAHFNAPASVVATFMVLQLAVYAVLQIPAVLPSTDWDQGSSLPLGQSS